MQEEDQPRSERSDDATGCAKTFGSCLRQTVKVRKAHPRLLSGMCRKGHRKEGQWVERAEGKASAFQMSEQHPGQKKTVLD